MLYVKTKHYKILIVALTITIILIPLIDYYSFKPRNSLELYQALAFSDTFEKAEKHDGYESNFSVEDFNTLKENKGMQGISQFTLFKYGKKTLMIETTPGTKKLEILRIVELPDDISEFFSENTN